MRTLVVLFSFLAVISAYHIRDGVLFTGEDPTAELLHEEKIERIVRGVYSTPLDHFSPTNNITLKLKYEMNIAFFKQGGPLFFFTDGFGELHRYGLMSELAEKLNGALITAHFRYHGQNSFENSELQKDMEYLTTEHILADIPYVVNEVKERLNSTSSRVITFGYLQGSPIAILARKKFPHIVDAAWSSSGQFRSVITDTETFQDSVKQIHKYGGANCTKMLSKAFQQLKQLVDEKNIGRIRELFYIAESQQIDLNDPQHIQFFHRVMFQMATTFFITSNPVRAIQRLCTNTVEGEDGLDTFSRWYRNEFGPHVGPAYSYSLVVEIVTSNLPLQTFYYFECFQIGWKRYATLPNGFENVFPNVVSEQFHDQFCTDVFGDRYNRTILERDSKSFNLLYGGGTQYVSNAVFSDGNMNPLRVFGISEYDPNSSKFIMIEYQGAFRDVYQISVNDTTELRAAKEEIMSTLSSYIGYADDVN